MYLDGMVVDVIAMVFQLCSRMMVFSLAWGHDGNDGVMLHHDNTTSSNNGNASNLVVINTINIDVMHGLLDDVDIVTRNTTVGATIDKGPGDHSTMHRSDSVDVCHINRMIASTVHNNFICSCLTLIGFLLSVFS